VHATEDPAPGGHDLREVRWHLADRRDFLVRSLEDARREHDAGDLDDRDYEALCRRDEAGLAEVEARLAAIDATGADATGADATGADATGATADAAPDAGAGARAGAGTSPHLPSDGDRTSAPAASPGDGARRPARGRIWFAVVGVAALVAGVVVLVLSLTTPRLPGQSATGSIDLGGAALVTQQLAQATTLVNEGKTQTALTVYEKVLAEDPTVPEALAEVGWIEWTAGAESKNGTAERLGTSEEEAAIKSTPHFYAPRYYLGTIYLDTGQVTAALVQYQEFLADHPPTPWLQGVAAGMRQAFTSAGKPVPAGLPGS
jgi:tetratricopeptide (TPR) repeat protein